MTLNVAEALAYAASAILLPSSRQRCGPHLLLFFAEQVLYGSRVLLPKGTLGEMDSHLAGLSYLPLRRQICFFCCAEMGQPAELPT